jgi:hypothetical protein
MIFASRYADVAAVGDGVLQALYLVGNPVLGNQLGGIATTGVPQQRKTS